MALRVDPSGAWLPKLTPALLDELAHCASEVSADFVGGLPYAKLDETARDRWRAVAREVYGAIALRGGGSAAHIPDDLSGPPGGGTA